MKGSLALIGGPNLRKKGSCISVVTTAHGNCMSSRVSEVHKAAALIEVIHLSSIVEIFSDGGTVMEVGNASVSILGHANLQPTAA